MAVIELNSPVFDWLTAQNFYLRGEAGSFGRGLDGRSQIMAQENRIWVGELRVGTLFTDERILAMRSLGTRLNGRQNTLRIPVYNTGTLRFNGDLNAFYAEIGYTGQVLADGFIRFSDGSTFSDGSGFALDSTAEPKALANASAGETELRLSGVIAARLAIGARFSINDFLYEVTDNNDGRVNFAPPLRTDVAQGDQIEVSQPYVQMRLQSSDGWEAFVDYGRKVTPATIALEEAFAR